MFIQPPEMHRLVQRIPQRRQQRWHGAERRGETLPRSAGGDGSRFFAGPGLDDGR